LQVSDKPRIFVVGVSDEAGEVVLQAPLSPDMEYPSKAFADS
jgi:hypothetical protein